MTPKTSDLRSKHESCVAVRPIQYVQKGVIAVAVYICDQEKEV